MLSHENISKIKSTMIRAGLNSPPAQFISDNNIHRFKINGDKGKPCWYVARTFSNDIVFIAFGCWKRGIYETWCSHNTNSLSLQEKDLIRQQQEQIKCEQQERQAKAKTTVHYIWEHAQPNASEHPYLQHKWVQSCGLRLYKGMLLVPLYNENNELSSLQFIAPNGNKWFKKDAPTSGCFFVIGELGEKIYIAEGYATAATIHEATGCGVIVAFNAYNLLPVAKIIRKKYPGKAIIVCADNDAFGGLQ